MLSVLTPRFSRDWLTLSLVGAGWFLSLALLLRVPIFGGVVGTALAVLGLFVLPGLGWLTLTGYREAWPWPAWGGLAFVAGLVPYSILALAALTLSYPAQGHPGAILLGGQVIQTILLALLWRRRRRTHDPESVTPPPEAGLTGLAVGVGVAVLLALYLTLTVSSYLPLGPQDAWDYAHLAQWTADHPTTPPPQSPGLRFLLNTWINLTAVLTWGTGTAAVDLLMRFLPVTLLVLSQSALYGLAWEVSGRRRVALLAIVAQLVMILTYMGSNALLGVFATLRLAEDKSLVAFVIVPIALTWLVRWLAERRWRPAIGLAVAGGVAVLAHPVALGLLAVSGGVYFVLTFAQRPDWKLLRRYGLPVSLLGVPLLILGLLLAGEERVGLGADLSQVRLQELFVVEANQVLLIGPPEANQYILHPGLLHPFMYATIAIAVLAMPYWRRKAARFLVATTLIPAALLFTPFLTPLLGQAVTLSMLERFLWIWPVGIAWGVALDAALDWLAARLARGRRWQPGAIQVMPGLIAFGLLALSVPTIEARWSYHFWFGTTQDIRAAETDVRDALAALAAESDEGVIHVAPPDRLLPVLVGYTPQVITHTRHRLEGLEVVELRETEWLNTTHLSRLRQERVAYVVTETATPATWNLFLRPDQFTPVYANDTYVVFHYANRPDTPLDALLLTLTNAAADDLSPGDPVWQNVMAGLELQRREPDAPPAIDEALGWLASRFGDYAQAVERFAAMLEAAPEATPLVAIPYVDAWIALEDFDEAGRLALDLLSIAAPRDVDLAVRLADLARRPAADPLYLTTLYDLALAPETASPLRQAVLRELLTTDLISVLSEPELGTLLTALDALPHETQPGAMDIATSLIQFRRDLARAEPFLGQVSWNVMGRRQDYWWTLAGIALIHDDVEAARAAIGNLSTIFYNGQWARPFFEGHLAAAAGDDGAALAAYEEAYTLNPGGQAVRLFLADAYERQARWQDAITVYESLAATPSGESYWGSYQLARLYDQLGQTALADAAYEQAVAQQRLYSPDLPLPPRDVLPTFRNPLLLDTSSQLIRGGINIVAVETITRTLEPNADAVFRICATSLLAQSRPLFWQLQIVEPVAPSLLSQERQTFPTADPLSAFCWPVILPVGDFERPAPPTRAQLEVITLEGGRVGEPVLVGWIMLAAPPPAPLPTGEPLAVFDDQFTLLDVHWDSPVPGEPLHVMLTWRAETAPREDYVFLLHLLDESGALVAQHDQQPYAGQYPTSVWPEGARVAMIHELDLPDDLPAGPLYLRTGIYHARTLDRLPGVTMMGEALQDGLLPLGTMNRSP